MKAYYMTTPKGVRKFLYISLDLNDAKKLFMTLKDYEGPKEVHLTTDHNFDEYMDKRTVEPVMVQICQNQYELNSRLAIVDVYL